MLIGIIALVSALNFALGRYEKYKKSKRQEFLEKIEVLKIISKHECFGKYKDDPTMFEDWFGKFLKLKGYKDIFVTPPQADGGKDVIATDKNGQTVYIECKLWDPKNWDINVGRPIAQKLVGAMYGDGISRGMIVTTTEITNEAKEYIKKVESRGIKVQLIDGEGLMESLYDLREVKLKEMVEAF